MTEDGRCIDEALAGNANAFGSLVGKYQDRLFATMVHVTGCATEAEDVVQEAFTQAFLKLDSFRRESQFYTWVYRIAFNRWVSRKRKKRPTKSLDVGREEIGMEPVDPQQSARDMMETQDDLKALQTALRQLPDEQREIVVLREIDGLSYEEIAQQCELPVGTVRSRLHRARKQLIELMKKNHPQMFVHD